MGNHRETIGDHRKPEQHRGNHRKPEEFIFVSWDETIGN